MTQETEIKLRVGSPAHAQALLTRQGFTVHVPRVFERNLIYDTAELTLRKSKRLLRLREVAGKVVLTFKGPPETGKHKSREEREVGVESFPEMQVILERLGYQVTFHYDKHRTEYVQQGTAGIATIDETPVGTFMELEGEAAWIDATAAALGFTEQDYITASYATLYSRGNIVVN